MNIEIKQLELIDQNAVDDILDLTVQLGAKYPPIMTIESLNETIKNPNTYIFVAYEGQKIVGMLGMSSLVVATGKKTWIEDVVVNDKYRGQGIASKLFDIAFAKAKELGIKHVNLTCNYKRVEANKLYKKLGFQINETNYYRYSFSE